jgi:hypothetical protein
VSEAETELNWAREVIESEDQSSAMSKTLLIFIFIYLGIKKLLIPKIIIISGISV